MSGIVGMIRWDGEEPPAGLARLMAERIGHRGPDGLCVLDRANASFGYLHLNTTQESFYEAQPLVNDRGLILVADARIDNRNELAALLGLSTAAGTQPIPDSRIILAAYEKWQNRCLDYLIGDFAFVIWDPATQNLFCGRDHSGVRPFYFHHSPRRYFLFASEIKALWAFPQLIKTIDTSRVANYLCHWGQFTVYQRNTFFETIRSLPPAHCLSIDRQQMVETMYWQIDSGKYRFETEAEYLAAFKATFEEAVACRIRTPFPVSSFLSGGLDSSSVSGVASAQLSKDHRTLDTYYIDTELEETSEKEYVIPFLEKHAVSHHEMTPDPDYYDSQMEVAAITDMPEMFSLTYNHFAPVLRQVSMNRSRVMLTGSDGDTVVGYGIEYIYHTIGRGDWKEAVRLLDLAHPKKYYQEKFGKERGNRLYYRRMAEIFWKQLPLIFPGRFRSRLQFVKGVVFYLKIPLLHLLRIGFNKFFERTKIVATHVVHPDLPRQCVPFLREDPGQHPTTNLLINRSLYYQMMSEISEYYDIIGAHHQVQIVHPFFDKRLIELCLFMPSKLKFYEGYGRGPLREAMKEYLPQKILRRKGKIDFTPYIHKQLDDLDPSPLAVIEENKNLLTGYVVANKTPEELLAEDKKTNWERLHHRILYFLHWRKTQGI